MRLVIGIILIFSVSFYIPVIFADSATESTDSHYIDGVPLIDQGNRPWCGPASVTMVLHFWHFNVTLEDVGTTIDQEEDGCYTRELVSYLRNLDIDVYKIRSLDNLKYYISKDHPIVVLTWSDNTKTAGHYRVITGYDQEYVYVNDPHGYTMNFTYDEFLQLLTNYSYRYGLTISPSSVFITDPYSEKHISITAFNTPYNAIVIRLFDFEIKEGEKLAVKNAI